MSAPEPPKPKKFTHASYIPSRNPKWKYHTGIGQMKNALTYMVREGWGYEVDGDELKELYHLDPNGPNMRGPRGFGWNEAMFPWKNTREEILKRRDREIKAIQAQIESLNRQVQRKTEELYERMRRDD